MKSDMWSILAKGLFGSGSDGVPSMRVQQPTHESHPIILYKMHEWSCRIVLPRITDSLILTPGPMLTFCPIETFGPSWNLKKKLKYKNSVKIFSLLSTYNCSRIYSCCWVNKDIANNFRLSRTISSQSIRMMLFVHV